MMDRDTVRPLRTIVVVAVVTALTNATGIGVLVISPAIRRVLDLRADAFGLLLSVGLGFGILGSLAFGWLADRGYLKASFSTAFGILVASYAACMLPASYPVYLLALACAGLANSGALTLANVTAARAFPDGSRKALTGIMLAHSTGGVIAAPLWQMLFEVFDTRFPTESALQLVFLAAACVCAAAGVLFFAFPFPAHLTGRKAPAAAAPGDRAPLWGLPLVVVCAFAALQAGAYNSLFGWIPDFATRTFAPNPFPVSWILSGISLSYVIGRLILLRLPERLPDLRIIFVCAGAGALLFGTAFGSTSQYTMGTLCVAGGLVLSADWPSIFSHTASLFPANSGKAIAMAGASAGVMSFVLPPFMGFIAEQTGSLRAGMMVPPLLFAVLSVSALSWERYLRRARSHSLHTGS
ncbi:MAG TPA: MFS transporter [Candidatus Latescibacteria bacterium]|nr:MAG: putative transporter [Candidatus Latescibacteria bacterium ADurb.Bin168]HPU86014.1 MFS transporter [Candidatus Latescibacterota bacterium]